MQSVHNSVIIIVYTRTPLVRDRNYALTAIPLKRKRNDADDLLDVMYNVQWMITDMDLYHVDN